MVLRSFLLLSIICTILTGCGGGGGGTPVVVPPPPPPPPPLDFRFEEAGSEVGFPLTATYESSTDAEHMGGGVSAVDFDADEDIDIYVMGSGNSVPNLLFENQGDGTFQEIAEAAGLDLVHRGSGPTFADVDGDGDLDLFAGGLNHNPWYLMRNDEGTFINVTADSGIVLNTPNTISATFSDYDLDGDLDLFLSHWGSPDQQDTETLWRNRGDGTFESFSIQSGIAGSLLGSADGLPDGIQLDYTLTPNLSDIDNDGDPDLLLTGDFGTTRIYTNNDDGTFTHSTDPDAITDENARGGSTGDYDNDGDMDWFVTSIFESGSSDSGEARTGNRLYRNDGNGVFEDVAMEAGVEDGQWGWGSCFADFDNDGHLDIFHVNGWSEDNYEEDPDVFFQADGDGTFTEKAGILGLVNSDQGRSAVCFDADRDGDLDILLTNNSENRLRYFRNILENGNHYLGIRLESDATNSHGVGARIEVTTTTGTQVREVLAGSNFTAQNPTEVHFGIGEATSADVTVHWPDGSESSMEELEIDRVLTITQTTTDVRLFVRSGFGSGLYDKGDVIAIEARPPSRALVNYVFSHWTSRGGGRFADAYSANTTFTMPGGRADVEAHYLPGVAPFSGFSVARSWNEVLLESIRNDFARPTVHARNLFHVSAAMYDAWTAYDEVAEPWLLGRTRAESACDLDELPDNDDISMLREESLSFAAYRIIRHRFENSPGNRRINLDADNLMDALGYDIENVSTDYADGSAAALGNHIADCYIRFGLNDGANEENDYENLFYEPVNLPLQPEEPGNPDIEFLNRWQPLKLVEFIDQAGNPSSDEPEFLGPEWGSVIPFSLSVEDLTVYERDDFEYWVYHDPGMPPTIDGTLGDNFKWGFSLVSIWSSHLDPADGVMIDISPANLGNIDVESYPLEFEEYPTFFDTLEGGDPSQGYEFNPVTGEPYTPQFVLRGDYARVLAEFWADGPDSETPPGHWFVILNEVNDHELLQRRFAGEGPELDLLEWDIKAYFLLGGAMHDVAITAWGIKGWYDYIRPISALRAMADRGQSSDPNMPSYHMDGITLQEGFIELVAAGDPLAGEEDEHVGKIKVLSWKGPDFINNPRVDVAGVDWILAENWWPYQRPSFVTPPFAGYVSGHSTYSRAAAEVFTALTGDEYFPGGRSGFEIQANEFLVFEDGPTMDMTLEWATYRDASDQCSLSRIWGGIHPPQDDIPGRLIGIQVGEDAFEHARGYFEGTIDQE